MRQCFKLSSIFLFIAAFSLSLSLPAKGLFMTLQEIEQEVDYLSVIIKECEEDYVEYEKDISDIDVIDDVSSFISGYDFLDDNEDCNYERELNDLGKELDKHANPGANVIIPDEDKKKIKQIQIKLERLQERNEKLKKRKKELKAKLDKLKNKEKESVVSELAAKMCMLLKDELEKEFGPLDDQVLSDETHVYGRVIAIDFVLPEGKILDDTWGDKVVAALARMNIASEKDVNEVRADGQEIVGKKASHIQVTTGTAEDYKSVIGITARFEPEKLAF